MSPRWSLDDEDRQGARAEQFPERNLWYLLFLKRLFQATSEKLKAINISRTKQFYCTRRKSVTNRSIELENLIFFPSRRRRKSKSKAEI